MPPWPKERVLRSTPFRYIGLDYPGPICVKEGGLIEKMWIYLFTCFVLYILREFQLNSFWIVSGDTLLGEDDLR